MVDGLESRVVALETIIPKIEDNQKETNTKLTSLDEKLDQLLIREAERKGETKAQRRIAAQISAIIALIISVGSAILLKFL